MRTSARPSVAEGYLLTLAHLHSPYRVAVHAAACQVARWLMRTRLLWSLPTRNGAFPAPRIGRLLGGQDHSTVRHGVAVITARLSSDRQEDAALRHLVEALGAAFDVTDADHAHAGRRAADTGTGRADHLGQPSTDDTEGPPVMTTWTPARASSVLLFLSKQTATRYARGMAKKHDDPLYTTPRFTTTQAAELLGLKRATVYSAIQRGHLETALASPGTHLISQAAIDTYRAHHLGQVGHPTRQKQRRTNTTTEATGAPPSAEAPTERERTHD